MSGVQQKILFVAVPAALGGSNKSLATLMSMLGSAETRVLAAPSRGKFREFAENHDLATEFVPLPSGSRLARIRAGVRIAFWLWRNRLEVSVIHAQALTGLNLVAAGAAISRLPVVVRVSDPVGSRWGRYLGPIVKSVVSDLRVVPVSETARDVAVENRLCPPEEAIVVPNPVDPNQVRAIERVRSHNGAIRVGFLGGATPRKGYDTLSETVEILAHSSIEWRLYMPDPGDGLIHPDRVGFLGRVPDVRSAYATCDIVFVPSRAESFCRVVAEAMVNGIPVVASDLPPIRALVGSEEAGLLFPAGDAERAAHALRELIQDESLRSSLGEAGRSRARDLEPEVISRLIAPIYERDWVRPTTRPASKTGQ